MTTASESPPWLAALAPYVERDDLRVPLAEYITMPIGTVIQEVRGVYLRLPRWTGEPFADDFGKKAAAMVELDGEHLFAELAVLRLLARQGWDGRWVSTFSTGKEIWKYLVDWRPELTRQEQRNRPIEEAEPRQLMARVAGLNRPNRYADCWDLFAWRESQFAFFQCKRGKPNGKEELKKSQVEWLRWALYLGDPRLRLGDFCFVLWDFQ